MRARIKAKLWTKPRHRLSFFTLYLLPVLRMDWIKLTQQEKIDYELNFNVNFYLIVGWLFWVYQINIKI